MEILQRPRRNRKNQTLRDLLQETRLTEYDLVYPLFVQPGENTKTEIPSMPGQFRHSQDQLLRLIDNSMNKGVRSFALFPALNEEVKDSVASESYNSEGVFQKAIFEIKKRWPECILFTDVAMDPYSSDGHDGVVEQGEILNDKTLPILAKMAISQAQAGADFVAPSDMMDGRVGFIRKSLDEAGFKQVGIMSYCAKFASGFYGPFRDALDSAPKFGDKKTYQMNPANRREALRELKLDSEEGADIVMVKPALSYLDIISDFKNNADIPVAAYNVSGEYAMIKAAAEKNWLNERSVVLEKLTSIKRAGADLIFTYHALDVAHWLKDSSSI
jgi:porphobilinogen synthase